MERITLSPKSRDYLRVVGINPDDVVRVERNAGVLGTLVYVERFGQVWRYRISDKEMSRELVRPKPVSKLGGVETIRDLFNQGPDFVKKKEEIQSALDKEMGGFL